MLIKRGVFEALSKEVREYAVETTKLKEFYTTDIDAETGQSCLRTIISAGWPASRLQGLCGALGSFDPYRDVRIRQPTSAELAGVEYLTLNPSASVG